MCRGVRPVSQVSVFDRRIDFVREIGTLAPLQCLGLCMVLRKVVAFIGLLGVISALAWQHGLFDRADAASPESALRSQAQAQAEAQMPAPAAPARGDAKSATKRLHSRH